MAVKKGKMEENVSLLFLESEFPPSSSACAPRFFQNFLRHFRLSAVGIACMQPYCFSRVQNSTVGAAHRLCRCGSIFCVGTVFCVALLMGAICVLPCRKFYHTGISKSNSIYHVTVTH